MSAVFALLASLVWGSSDYVGGKAARTVPVAWVILIGQGCALLVLLTVVTADGLWRFADCIAWGTAAGFVGPVAIAAFYTALSTGTMGVVAPVASCGVLVPVVVGFAQGEQPAAIQVVGIAITVTGVLLAGRAVDGGRGVTPENHRRSVLLAVVAAGGFGAVLACIAQGSHSSAATTITVQRLVSVLLVGTVVLVRRPALRTGRSGLGFVVGAGLGDAGANALYAVSVSQGLVSIDAVLSSLYPVVTALLARRVDGERLERAQAAGVATALIGVVLLATG